MFTHLLCVKHNFEEVFWNSFLFMSLSHVVQFSMLPSKYQSQITKPQFFSNCMCCVFRPAFGCLQHPKAGRNIFFSRFSTFFVLFCWFQTFFSDFTAEINKKWTKKNVKLSTPQSWSTCKSWSTPWGGTPKLSLFGWFSTFFKHFFVSFRLVSVFFH